MAAPSLDLHDVAVALPAGLTVASVLATGGQGVVFSGACAGVNAAVKVYTSTDGTTDTRLDREIRALQALSSPHVGKRPAIPS